MRQAERRGRRITAATVWPAIVATLVVHIIVLRYAEGLNLVGFGSVAASGATSPVAIAEDLKTTCVGDAVLGSSARYAMCFAPWRSDTDACLDSAGLDMWMDLSSCVAQRNPDAVAAISMLEPRQADKVKPIDPEPLLEMMKEQDKPTPKPPELVQQQPQPQSQPPPPPPAPPPQRPMQVVETAKPNTEKEPENAHLLAEHNTVADKQTVARGAVKEPMVAKSKPEELTAAAQPKEASIHEATPDRRPGVNKDAPDTPGTLSMRAPGVQVPAETQQDAKTRGASTGGIGPIALDGISPRKGDGSFEQERRERSEIPKGQNGAGGGAPDVPNLKPSQEVLERALGGGSVDHLDDAASGDETALNAKRWVHATFFNRLKRSVAQNWDPGSVWRRRDPTGQVYGSKTRITEVRVALSQTGSLAKIVVTQPSGVSELDDEAVRAFNQAAPFVNPPKELANGDGLIVFAFSFYFEVGTPSTSWRVVRSM
jgi:TonB family protein